MANNIGYEELEVGTTQAISPTDATVRGGVACAIFYVDPASAGTVRYRADRTAPTARAGLPLRAGRSIVVAGEGNVRNSQFITESDVARVHCLYYDRVDVVDLGLTGASLSESAALTTDLATARQSLEEIALLLRQLRMGMNLLVDEDLAKVS